jgi:hypothetical protein
MVFKMSRDHSDIYGPCDIDLKTIDPKIKRCHLLVMINQYVKYEDFVIKCFQDNERKPFCHLGPVTLTFDIVIPISIGFIY